MEPETNESLINDSVAGLVALGAAMAANNAEAFQQANYRLEKLGVDRNDRIKAVNIAIQIKMAPYNDLMDMAQGYLAGHGEGCGCGEGCGEGACECGEDGCGCGEEGCGCGEG